MGFLFDVFEAISCVGFIAVLWFFFSYLPKRKKQVARQSAEKKRSEEQLAYQQQHDRICLGIREEMEHGSTLRQCSEVIDAYIQMNNDELFDMCGNILVIVPQPQDILNFQRNIVASEMPVEVVFDAYYDNWHLRGLLRGDAPFNASDIFDGVKTYQGIPQYLADNYGVPQILIDKKVSIVLDELKVKWSISITPAVGLYGSYNDVGFQDRFRIFRDLLKNQYPGLNNLSITFLR